MTFLVPLFGVIPESETQPLDRCTDMYVGKLVLSEMTPDSEVTPDKGPKPSFVFPGLMLVQENSPPGNLPPANSLHKIRL